MADCWAPTHKTSQEGEDDLKDSKGCLSFSFVFAPPPAVVTRPVYCGRRPADIIKLFLGRRDDVQPSRLNWCKAGFRSFCWVETHVIKKKAERTEIPTGCSLVLSSTC
uniref:Uncharacterized protein n=1 Tax=Grammatophora oceanica TaxID=210454 RepID=A0A7S1Y2F6_9STRA|mmetsp:Transcript_12516/g.18403  ORF Transcript_12516/g.18403 Transcript_12516/m.18403 type:complete len:108 (+) Transcript_12516:1074-1397(+)